MSDRPTPAGREEPERVVIRDKRRIDPVTGAARAPDSEPGPLADPAAPRPAADAVADLQAAVAERTADLQRVQAEYANYRKRADRDRLAATDVAISRILTELLPVLDDIDRARTHDDLTGALKAVADHLDGIFGKLGLQVFGEVGDPFDPSRHEAVMHTESDDVTEPTCTIVMRRGYQHGERLLRPAMVGVTEPAADPGPPSETSTAPTPTEAPNSDLAAAPTPAEAANSDGSAEPDAERSAESEADFPAQGAPAEKDE